MCDQLEAEPEVDYSTSVFIDNLEICDSFCLIVNLVTPVQVARVDFLESRSSTWMIMHPST